ncbi:type II secretion system F family protein [Corynebacterium sp. CCM 9204]|uniref:type II secretion system F family protein n=1 Tax=Corynebacterium sp. CCM 9204 TaxID=3057616 RepID=UPI003523F1BE
MRSTRVMPGIFLLVLAVPFVFLTPLTVSLSLIVAVITCTWWVFSARRYRQRARVADATADIISRLVADLHAGTAMPDAVRSISESLGERGQVPASITEVLCTAARRAATGSGAAMTLAEAGDLPDLAAAGRLWELSESYGIPLATLLDQARSRTDARIRHRSRTQAALQGPQASALVLTLLPPFGMLMGILMGAHPIELLTGGGAGGLLLLGGVLLTCAGIVSSRIIVLRAAGGAP